MKVWSIRTLEELAILEKGLPLRTDPNKADRDFRQAYLWMAEQLKHHFPPPEGVIYPIWVWRYCQGKKRPKPDLRTRCFLKTGTKGVRLELEILEQKLLLSDFDGWHAVLNDHPYVDENNDCQGLTKEESWQKIFALDHLSDDDAIQGVTWEIFPSEVVRYRVFTSR